MPRKSAASRYRRRKDVGRTTGNRPTLGLPPIYKAQPILQRKFRFISTNAGTANLGIPIYGSHILSILGAQSGPTGSANGQSFTMTSIMIGARIKRLEIWAPPPASGFNRSSLFIEGGAFGASREIESTATSAGTQSAAYIPAEDETIGMWMSWDSTISNFWEQKLFTVTSSSSGTVLDIVLEFVLQDQENQGYTAVWVLSSGLKPGLHTNTLDNWASDGTSAGTRYFSPVGAAAAPAPSGGLTIIGA
jgi:hypothetical protein